MAVTRIGATGLIVLSPVGVGPPLAREPVPTPLRKDREKIARNLESPKRKKNAMPNLAVSLQVSLYFFFSRDEEFALWSSHTYPAIEETRCKFSTLQI